MKCFIEGTGQGQGTLFPEALEDWIDEDNPVRAIDVFVDELDLGGLGFIRAEVEATGRPGYHPSVLLKVYIYGYLNRIQSSRRLEREAGRNVEVMWLTGRLVPDHKTIADFRKDNGAAIGKVCSRFVALCRQLGLFAAAAVAIDGSKFKAVNNRDRNFTRAKLKQEMQRLEGLEAEMLAAPEQQISLTDPDSRSMATSGRGSGVVGYNVQTAVDTEHHLIVAHEVTNVGSDRSQLANISSQAKAALEADKLAVVADRGYFNSREILACDQAGITVTPPKPMTSNAKARGRFGKQDFRYRADEDVYIRPADERLGYRFTRVEGGLALRPIATYLQPRTLPGCAFHNQAIGLGLVDR